MGLNREGQQAATHGDGPVGTGDEAGPVRRRHLLRRGPQQRRARQRVESPQRGQRRRRRTGRKLQGGFQRGLRIAAIGRQALDLAAVGDEVIELALEAARLLERKLVGREGEVFRTVEDDSPNLV